ncbi:MAG: hypothetical protein U5K74_02055 [Gemmatimonadaceae bacterium]|nr:hypothetical protein [Gemmatimonadaceae bacterium]
MSASPPQPETPSGAALLRSTLIAMAVAGLLLVTCVLPAEYGVDPTGIGRVLGLTQMGEVKLALAEEAANNAAAEASADSVIAAAEASADPSPPSGDGAAETSPAATRVDTTLVTLAPNMSAEVKLVMDRGVRARYDWQVRGGVVNFDMHGDSANAPKDWFVSYAKGTRAAADSGELVAGFDGNHGWFWRNRGRREVQVRLITSGRYLRIVPSQ